MKVLCAPAGAVLNSLAALGGGLTIEHFCEASQRIHTMQHQQSERAAGVEQQQLMDLAERHVAGLTGQVSSDSQSPFRPDSLAYVLSKV